MRSDPATVRWLVGVELKHYRLRAHKTSADAGKVINTNHSKVTHMETGRYGQKPEEVAALLEFYNAPGAEVDRIVSFARQDDGPSWWEPWKKVVSDDFSIFLGLEGMAEREVRYDPLLIPALFQTEAYALAVTGLSHRVPVDLQETVVELRMERQQRLTEQEPLKIRAVIEESVLYRVAGSNDIMIEQLQRLIELSELPNVDLRILPTARGLRAATFGHFNLLALPSGREIVYVESLYGVAYVHDKAEVRGYNLMIDSVRDDILDEDESVALIKKVVKQT